MLQEFIHEPLAARILFGFGTLTRIRDEARRMGGSRAMILCTPGRGEALGQRIARELVGSAAEIFAGARMHTPVEVTEAALASLRQSDSDLLVAIGGGSAIGLAKALALRTDLPQIVLPTTYAGSEMTSILGETDAGRKTTQRSAKVLPETVIYDVELTLTLPARVSVASGMNAIAHGVEGLYAPDGNPVHALLAQEGIARMASALPRIRGRPSDTDARADALYGAFLCGGVLGATRMGLHHKLAHVLGGMFDLPHAETHTALLPHVAAYNAPAAGAAMAQLARALDAQDPAQGLYHLAQSLGATMALREFGMTEDGIARALDEVLASPGPNPRPLERDGLRLLLERAWRGDAPLSA